MKLSVIAAVSMLAAIPVAGTLYAQPPSTTQARPSDQELSNLIAKNISNDPTLSADAVRVSVTRGVVTLRGIVGKDADKAKAEQLATVPGVVRVDNKLKSREKATDKAKGAGDTVADTTKKAAKETKNAVSKTGEAITDGWISTRIKGNFAGEQALNGSDIKVDAKDHVVTLSGTVPNAAAHARALVIAKEVEGVNRVVDKLTVAPKIDKS
ncbi:MAG: BON domain-containing protein [Vicinamibacterales bacterium]